MSDLNRDSFVIAVALVAGGMDAQTAWDKAHRLAALIPLGKHYESFTLEDLVVIETGLRDE